MFKLKDQQLASLWATVTEIVFLKILELYSICPATSSHQLLSLNQTHRQISEHTKWPKSEVKKETIMTTKILFLQWSSLPEKQKVIANTYTV